MSYHAPVQQAAAPQREKISFTQKIGADEAGLNNNRNDDDEIRPAQLGQFSEPGGVAATPAGELIVADTNNHRIQIFNADGSFKLAFGQAGKREGQTLYPIRVAYCSSTKRIVFIERAPTHQVQIWSANGRFIKKFGADALEHPRALAVDRDGNIIVVECRVMLINIFNRDGSFMRSWKCDNLEFPNGVAVDAHQQIYVSDNRAHCVRVYNYGGQFVCDIGGAGLTNYPIGVCVASTGNVLVADNHNNFNVTVFSASGKLQGLYESVVKHAQCLDVTLVRDGVLALASKDCKIFVYPYKAGGAAERPSTSGNNGQSNTAVVLPLSSQASHEPLQVQQQPQQLQRRPPQQQFPASVPRTIPRAIPASSTPQQQQQHQQTNFSGNFRFNGNGGTQSYENDPVVAFRQAMAACTRDLAACQIGGENRYFENSPYSTANVPQPSPARRSQGTQTTWMPVPSRADESAETNARANGAVNLAASFEQIAASHVAGAKGPYVGGGGGSGN